MTSNSLVFPSSQSSAANMSPADTGGNGLARALVKMRATGDHGGVERVCRRLIKQGGEAKAIAGSKHLLGLSLYHLGRNAEALRWLRESIIDQPREIEYRDTLGRILAELGQYQAALQVFQEALQISPVEVPVLNHLAELLRKCGQATAALKVLEAAAGVDPENSSTLVITGDSLFELKRYDEALKCYDQALALSPDHGSARTSRAFVLECMGRREEAVADYREVTELDPVNLYAHWRLASLVASEPGDGRVDALKKILTTSTLSTPDASRAHFTLGRLYDDRDEIDEAFEHYRRANELRGHFAGREFRIDDYARAVGDSLTIFDREYFAQRRDWGNDAAEPVFIVGMPGSGTALIESVLAAHPQVHGAGELEYIREIRKQLAPDRGETDLPTIARSLQASHVEEAADQYHTLIRAQAPEARRIVDGMPQNFRHLWLIALLFPRARVIHCRRDARDTCLSCWTSDFGQGHGYRNDLSTLGRYWRLYDRLMQHWNDVLPLPILDLSYEDFVQQPHEVGRRLMDFLEVPWDTACLPPHQRRGGVTVSAVQARRTTASPVGRWRRYEEHLGPLMKALE